MAISGCTGNLLSVENADIHHAQSAPIELVCSISSPICCAHRS